MDGRYSPLAQLSFAGQFEGELDTIVNYSIARQFVAPSSQPTLWLTSRRPLLIERLVISPEDVLEVPQLEVNKIQARVFEELQAKLNDTVLQAHAECRHKARHGVWMREDFQRKITQQEPGLCPVSAGFERWSQRFHVEAEQDRKFALRVISAKMPYLHARYAQRQLAQFYSSVATAYVYELLQRKGCRLETTVQSPLRVVLERYSFGIRDRDAYGEIWGPSDAEKTGRWIVMGAPSLIELAGKLHGESLKAPAKTGRIHRMSRDKLASAGAKGHI